MICPHCRITVHDKPKLDLIDRDADGYWALQRVTCPACSRLVLHLKNGEPSFYARGGGLASFKATKVAQVYPKGASRPSSPKEVPDEFAEDYNEACLVLADSPKASAALSRRCSQHVLREKAQVKQGNLANEIQQVLDQGTLPPYIADVLDAVRNIGNFAAHPIKSQNTGEVLPVEPGEADWNLDVLESLFDFYFVQPAKVQQKKNALNKKLGDAGKPQMK